MEPTSSRSKCSSCGFRISAALEAYLSDPRRTALIDERDRVVARTELFPVSRPHAKYLG